MTSSPAPAALAAYEATVADHGRDWDALASNPCLCGRTFSTSQALGGHIAAARRKASREHDVAAAAEIAARNSAPAAAEDLTAAPAAPEELPVPVATAPAATRHETREAWLVAAVAALAPVFAEQGETLPPVRVSVGWPGGRGKKNAVIGQCWKSVAATDGVAQLFVSPVLPESDPARILDVLAHELVHAVDDCESGHQGRFAKIAKAIGLEGKMTATVASAALRERLESIAAGLGEFPHAAIAFNADGAEGPKKQSTRMLKVECADGSGYKVRMTRQWLDEVGAPLCPCHQEPMQEAAA